jgi:hypothetical protein
MESTKKRPGQPSRWIDLEKGQSRLVHAAFPADVTNGIKRARDAGVPSADVAVAIEKLIAAKTKDMPVTNPLIESA